MSVLSAEQTGGSPDHPAPKPTSIPYCFSVRGQVSGVGVAQPLTLAPVGPPLVLPYVEVGLVPREAQVVSQVGGVVGLYRRGGCEEAREEVWQGGGRLAGQGRLGLVQLLRLFGAPSRFEERGTPLPAPPSQHEVFRRPRAIVLHVRMRYLSRVEAVEAGRRNPVVLEAVGFELAQTRGTVVTDTLFPEFSHLYLIIVLKALGAAYSARKADLVGKI